MIKKEGILKKIIYFNYDNNYIIAITDDNEKVSGTFEHWLGKEAVGFKFKFEGDYKKDKKRNENILHFKNIELLDDPFMIFLKRNIGHFRNETLRMIFDIYNKEEIIDILDNNIEKFNNFKFLGTSTLKKISAKWKKQKDLLELSLPLLKFGLTENFINRLYRYIKKKELKIDDFLKEFYENPYILTKIDLIGFKTADKLALKTGISKNSIFRIEAGILFNFTEIGNQKGDTAVHFNDIVKELEKIEVITTKDKIEEALNNLIKKEEVKLLKDNYYSLMKYYIYEKYILDFVTNLRKKENKPLIENINEFIKEEEEKLGIKVSAEQREAIELVNSGLSVFALCGYAGTGKSTVSKIVLNLFKGKNILCTAVSGIATDRIRKATSQKSVIMYGILIKKVRINNVDVLLIDESSMVNSEQFYYLLKELEGKNNIKIIFVGDKAQLPPIGPGNFFTDIIENRLVPFIELTKIYRQSDKNVLTTFSKDIRNGIIPKGYHNGVYKDFQFITQEVEDFWTKKNSNYKHLDEDKRENYKKIREIICNKYVETLSNKKYHLNINWFDYVYNNQIITPMKKYALGVEVINNAIQKKLADTSKCIKISEFMKFCLYDKVVHTRNKDIEVFEGLNLERAKGSFLNKRRIFNGMLGMIIDVDPYNHILYVVYPAEQLIAKYYMSDLQTLNLGYAITIHKSQGAEYKNVYIPITYAHFIMLNNKLLYTAITRAKTKATLVGERSAFSMACKKHEETKRFSVIQAILFDNFTI